MVPQPLLERVYRTWTAPVTGEREGHPHDAITDTQTGKQANGNRGDAVGQTIREQQIVLLKYVLRDLARDPAAPEGTIGEQAYRDGYAAAMEDACRKIDARVKCGLL